MSQCLVPPTMSRPTHLQTLPVYVYSTQDFMSLPLTITCDWIYALLPVQCPYRSIVNSVSYSTYPELKWSGWLSTSIPGIGAKFFQNPHSHHSHHIIVSGGKFSTSTSNPVVHDLSVARTPNNLYVLFPFFFSPRFIIYVPNNRSSDVA